MGETRNVIQTAIPVFNESKATRNLMEAFSRKIQFDLRGEPGPFNIVIESGRIKLVDERFEDAEVVVSGDTKEFAKVVVGQIDVTHLIARGQIKIERGKVSDMILLGRIFLAAKRG